MQGQGVHVLFNRGNLVTQFVEIGGDSLPDDIEVQFEITMGHAVADTSHFSPGDVGMRCDEFRIFVDELGGGFAYNQNVVLSVRNVSLLILRT